MYLLVVPDLGYLGEWVQQHRISKMLRWVCKLSNQSHLLQERKYIPRFSMGEVKNNIIRMRNKRGNWERYLAKEGTAISRSVVTISFKSEIVKSRWI
ncbi:hypothetical protein F2Q69_00027215 [Brassica cretica]|uniref:Uncharacterized protein n=1 Tax=Brassica cretica TaxID=69181 RepID=A0A8S9S4T1_BRACR|nr:hypothetical protein F2Q69_00027215 [Brassica cretica]